MTQTMVIDDTMLASMLEKSQFAHPQEEEYWFSRGNQKKMVFDIGVKLLVSEDMTPLEAVNMAQEYVDTFYQTTLAPQSWNKE